MDFSGSENYDDLEEVKSGGRGCFGRLVFLLLSVVAVVILAVVGTALFLSTDLGRLWVLNKINRSITPARLSVSQSGMSVCSVRQSLKVLIIFLLKTV